MTDEEREEVLQLLANYENMSRAIATFIQRVRTDPKIDVKEERYRLLLDDLERVAPVWKRYATSVRLKLMMERRESPDPSRGGARPPRTGVAVELRLRGRRYRVTGGSPSSARAPSSNRSVPAAADAAVHSSAGLPLASASIRALIACDARAHACTSRPCVRSVRLENLIPLTTFAIDDSSIAATCRFTPGWVVRPSIATSSGLSFSNRSTMSTSCWNGAQRAPGAPAWGLTPSGALRARNGV